MNIIARIKKALSLDTSRGLLFKVFGLTFAFGRDWGNCFSPALHFEWCGVCKGSWSHDDARKRIAQIEAGEGSFAYKCMTESFKAMALKYAHETLADRNRFRMPAWAVLTIRTHSRIETKIYFRGYCGFNWSSDHVAYKWGERSEADFGEMWIYNGWLGHHTCF
ncbi:MAG: hypothetical protein ACYSR9_03540 [Planctomycetota bacterium]|jgi:hypothetical protein